MKDAQENSLQSQQDYFAEYIRHHRYWYCQDLCAKMFAELG